MLDIQSVSTNNTHTKSSIEHHISSSSSRNETHTYTQIRNWKCKRLKKKRMNSRTDQHLLCTHTKKKDERTKVLPEHRERGMTKILIRKNKIFLFGKKAAAKGRKSNLCDQLPIHREREKKKPIMNTLIVFFEHDGRRSVNVQRQKKVCCVCVVCVQSTMIISRYCVCALVWLCVIIVWNFVLFARRRSE